MALFGRSTQATVGVACDGTRLRAAEVRHTEKGPIVHALGQADVPSGAVAQGRIADPDAFGLAVSDLLSSCGAEVKDVSVNIPNRHATVKRVEIPNSLLESYDDWLSFEAGQFVGGDLSEYLVDAHQVRTNPTDKTTDMLLVAVRTTAAHEIVSALRGAGLRPFSADIDSCALANGFERAYPGIMDEVVALCDVEATETSVTLVDRGSLAFAAGFPTVSGVLDEDVDVKNFASELGGYMEALAGATLPVGASRRLDRVLVSGMGAKSKILQHGLRESMNAAIEVATPFLAIDVENRKGNAEEVRNRPFEYCLAVGLAMRRKGDDG